jgi:predicted esterase
MFRCLLIAAGVLAAPMVVVAQVKPRLAGINELQNEAEYLAFVPDPQNAEPAVVVVLRRDEPALARHLLQSWVDAATRQGVSLIAPLGVSGSLSQQAEQIKNAISLWGQRNRRAVRHKVVVGYSLSTELAIEAALAMPEEWAGIAFAPAWDVPPAIKPKLHTLKDIPVLFLWSEAHPPDIERTKSAMRDFKAAGCTVFTHAVKMGTNTQTTYWNGDSLFRWAREIGKTPYKMKTPEDAEPTVRQPDEEANESASSDDQPSP